MVSGRAAILVSLVSPVTPHLISPLVETGDSSDRETQLTSQQGWPGTRGQESFFWLSETIELLELQGSEIGFWFFFIFSGRIEGVP